MIGANGFLGRAVSAALQDAGIPVAQFTRESPFVVGGEPAEGLRYADVVYYLASRANPATAEREPELVAEELDAFGAFLGAISQASPRPLVVFPSSGGTVYDTDVAPPYTEASPVRPRGAYGRSRLEMERLLLAEEGPATVLRISNVYGPGQRTGRGQGVIAHWVEAAAQGEPITLFGDPDVIRDFVHVDDVARAALAVTRLSPPVVNIGSGVATSLGSLAALVDEVFGGVEIVREPDRGFDVPHNWLDVTLAREALGWEPTVSLREGLRRLRDTVDS